MKSVKRQTVHIEGVEILSILDILGKKIVFFDGGTGTLLQEKGLQAGEIPELWNIERADDLVDIHRRYFEAGADIVLTNTFGGNGIKLKDTGKTVSEIVTSAVNNVKKAMAESGIKDRPLFCALDIGPTGKLLKPMGDLSFDDSYNAFKEIAICGEKAGADLVLIETMSDTYELKSAVLAVKENTNLPVFATVVFDEKGKLLTGGDVKTVVAMLEGLGIDALGVNCGLGPVQMKDIALEILKVASVPVIVNPNAGLPRNENGKTVYDVTPEKFSDIMKEIAEAGAWVIGGCCGTTPKHIALLKEKCENIKPKEIEFNKKTIVTSYARAVEIDDIPVIIGERINPTGKSRFKQALRENDIDYILREGFAQQKNGAHILDVNVGLPDIDEVSMLETVTKELQSVIDLPLQIDTSNVQAMERALRYYNGKAMVNSVNGKKESMEAVFPIVKKYGGVVVGLTLDEGGIPETAEGRFEVAKKIVETAKSYGIDKKDIVIDVLCMTVSSDNKSALVTLEALKMVKERLGVRTILGVSNISFGLPQRGIINSNFYTMALMNGLDSAIINPASEDMMKSYYSYKVLSGKDESCVDYIEHYSSEVKNVEVKTQNSSEMTLKEAIEKGFKDQAGIIALEMTNTMKPLDIINSELIPALDTVGKGFEKGTIFLPQLLMSAESAKSAFESIKTAMDKSGEVQEKKGKVILATVKGDIHDIGKNIVKVLLENYSFEVYDLGKDVPIETVVETAIENDVKLVGLSALMTTTVTSMEETIKALREKKPDCKVMVGGAVLTQEYADMIKADQYVKDAMASVYYAEKVLSGCNCCK